jgi:hypothetical protein
LLSISLLLCIFLTLSFFLLSPFSSLNFLFSPALYQVIFLLSPTYTYLILYLHFLHASSFLRLLYYICNWHLSFLSLFFNLLPRYSLIFLSLSVRQISFHVLVLPYFLLHMHTYMYICLCSSLYVQPTGWFSCKWATHSAMRVNRDAPRSANSVFMSEAQP